LIRRIFCAALIALVIFTGISARAEAPLQAEPDSPLIRLHVIAENDSRPAQRLKMHVRDAVLEYAKLALKDCTSEEEAWQRIRSLQAEFETIARTAAGQQVTAQLGIFPFPDRTYAGTTVPAGQYRALRIVIGPGEGRNWWCVLYPSLCLPSEGGYYSLFGRWLEKFFGGESA